MNSGTDDGGLCGARHPQLLVECDETGGHGPEILHYNYDAETSWAEAAR